MEQNVVARRTALLAGLGAYLFIHLEVLRQRFEDSDYVLAPITVTAFASEFAALATAYCALVFKGRAGVVFEVLALTITAGLFLTTAWTFFNQGTMPP